MGPGYFPFVISCLLLLFGLVSIVRSMRVSGEPVEPFAWKPIATRARRRLRLRAADQHGRPYRRDAGDGADERGGERKVPLRLESDAWVSSPLIAFCSLVFVMGLGVPLPLLRLLVRRLNGRAPVEIFANLWLGLRRRRASPTCSTASSASSSARRSAFCLASARSQPSRCCLPLTFGLPPVSALIMLAGIFYGAQYGGSTTAILVNLPGESSSRRHRDRRLPDGPARQGRASAGHRRHRLLLCRHGLRRIVIALFAPPLADLALQVRPGRLFLADGAWPCRLDRARAPARCCTRSA